MLDICIYLVFGFLLIVCALLLLVVLMQRPKQEGLGAAFGSQMTDQAFGARTTDVLKKGTVIFGVLFMGLSLVLTILISKKYALEKSDLATRSIPAVKAEKEETVTPVSQPEIDLSAKLLPSAETPAPMPVPVSASAPMPEQQNVPSEESAPVPAGQKTEE